jgi:ectoine hydroxylase-related dioxygenase (phytanoyl-CoA dioxygenase family)
LSNPVFTDFLQTLLDNGFIKSLQDNFFNSNCILNSLSALNNLPNQPNFSAVVHRDLRFYSGEFPIMLNCLIMLDDFTIENGGTYLLPKSHLEERKPSDEEFFKNAIQAVGIKGDILIFNANVWHASAPNTTQSDRRAIPFTVSKSFMKQLLDYPRALGYNKMDSYSTKLQQFLGYHSRVPASLEEWYQPEDKRFYKKNQD